MRLRMEGRKDIFWTNEVWKQMFCLFSCFHSLHLETSSSAPFQVFQPPQPSSRGWWRNLNHWYISVRSQNLLTKCFPLVSFSVQSLFTTTTAERPDSRIALFQLHIWPLHVCSGWPPVFPLRTFPTAQQPHSVTPQQRAAESHTRQRGLWMWKRYISNKWGWNKLLLVVRVVQSDLLKTRCCLNVRRADWTNWNNLNLYKDLLLIHKVCI